jgi:hypothetical protein
MLRSVIGVAAGAALVFAVGARPAQAMSENVQLKAHIPFAFEVEGRTMPAGNYEIKSAGSYESNVIEIRSLDGHGPDDFFLTVPRKTPADLQRSEMVFDRIGTQRFLRSVLVPGETGVSVPADRVEVQAARAESGSSKAGRS